MSSIVRRAHFQGTWQVGTLLRLELQSSTHEHSLVLLDFPRPKSELTGAVPEEAGVLVEYGRGPLDVKKWWGYVNHHEDLSVDGKAIRRYWCVGTSLHMNDPNPRSWQSVSPTFIAKEVAQGNGLRTIVTESKLVLPYWTQGVESDFLMMNRLAKEIGYRFWVDGPNLYFMDPLVLAKPTPQPPVIHTPDELHVVSGSLAPRKHHNAVTEVFGIDAATGAFIQTNSGRATRDIGLEAPSHRSVIPVTAASLDHAHRLTDGVAANTEWVTLSAKIPGDSRMTVGGLAAFNSGPYFGNWTVDGVTHVISNEGFSTEVELTRNQLDDTFHLRNSGSRESVRELNSVWRNNRWESEVLESVYV